MLVGRLAASLTVAILAVLVAALALLTLVMAPAACGLLAGDTQERVTIPPASARPSADLGLGPGVRSLSLGPGDKGSPRIDPSGERVAFVVDGYVAEKPLYAQDFQLRTARGFGAEGVEWLPGGDLAVLGPREAPEGGSVGTTLTPSPLFIAHSEGDSPDSSSSEGDLNPHELAKRIVNIGAVPGSQAVTSAMVTAPAPGSSGKPSRNRLMVLLQGPEEPIQVYLGLVKGYVTGLSVSPDGRGTALAVRRDLSGSNGEAEDQFEVQVYPFSEGQATRVAHVPRGMEILGAPQWTSQGIYFVVGETDATDEAKAVGGDLGHYALYRATEGSDTLEPVRGVGEDFVPSSISVSPDGARLAVVGRRNPGSPTNLYVLDLASGALDAATTNENMEIKTNPRDLAWYPDGSSVVLVARGAFSGPEVYDDAAQSLSSAFYNLYEVAVRSPSDASGRGSER